MKIVLRLFPLVLLILNAPPGAAIRGLRKIQKPSGEIADEPLVELSSGVTPERNLWKKSNKKKKKMGNVNQIYVDFLLQEDDDAFETIVKFGPVTIQASCRDSTLSSASAAFISYIIEPQDYDYYLTGTTVNEPDFGGSGIKLVRAQTQESGNLLEALPRNIEINRNFDDFGSVRATDIGVAFGIYGETSYAIGAGTKKDKLRDTLGVDCLIQGIIWYAETSDMVY